MKNTILFISIFILFMSCDNVLDKKAPLVKISEKWRNGNLTEAKADVKDYLKRTPDNEFAWALLGHIESDFNEDSLAIAAYKKALKLNPKTLAALTGMGIVARKKGDYDKASDYYYQAIDIDPDYAAAYSSLVTINLKRKKFKEAVEVGLKAYNLNKNNGIIAANLSLAYHFVNDTIQRDKYFDIAKKNGYKNIETLKDIFKGE